jgi:hypothetical protein
MSKLTWYLKQLFPLKYDTEYSENGKNYVTIWKMWLGRCFSIKKYELR